MNRLQPSKATFLLFILMLQACLTTAQVKLTPQERRTFKRTSSVQVEALGYGGYYSVNYERILYNMARFKLGVQLGAGYLPASTGAVPLNLPLTVNGLISFNRHHIECGPGAMLSYDEISDDNHELKPYLCFKAGYRYQPPLSRWLVKALFTPLLELTEDKEFLPWGALGIGYTL